MLLFFLSFLVSFHSNATVKNRESLPFVENFRLLDSAGISHELHRKKNYSFIVLVAYQEGCPILRKYASTLNSLQETFSKDTAFFYIYPKALTALASVQKEKQSFNQRQPILLDLSQNVSSKLGLKRSAEVVVIDVRDWRVLYQGAIDDRVNYDVEKVAPQSQYLREALLAARKGLSSTGTESRGCAIFYDPEFGYGSQGVSYKTAANILVRRCVSCHSEQGMAPWSMRDHSTLRSWTTMMAETIRTKRMPPWQPDPFIGSFHGEARLTPKEEALVLNWISAGASKKENSDPLTKTTFSLSKPAPADFQIPLPPQTLSATGPIDYRYVFVDAPNNSDLWVRVKITPSNPKTLHHATVFVVDDDGTATGELKERFDKYLATYAPGANYDLLEQSYVRRLPAKAKLMVVLHYQATGKVEADTPVISVWTYKGRKPKIMTNIAIKNFDFTIQPRLADQKVEASWTTDQAYDLHAMILHMHYRGSAIRLDATYPDGKTEALVSAPTYNLNWQHIYVLKNLKRIPKNTKLKCTGTYDNSSLNPFNPDPEKTIKFGLQTTDEMLMCHLELLQPTKLQ